MSPSVIGPNGEKVKVPVLFKIDKTHANGRACAYMHNKDTAAFLGEEEYLIGNMPFIVRKISQEDMVYREGGPGGKETPMKVTVITLKDY